jgi:ankyrin repeat protein
MDKRLTVALLLVALLLGACSREYNTELMTAAKDGNLAAVQAVYQRGGDVNQANNKGKRALMFAASEGHVDVVKWLIEQGADVNVADNFGTTALIVAATAGHDAVVKLLLENGADTQVRDESGGAPLVNAIYFGHQKSVQLLLDKMPPLSKQDGDELLMLAAGLGHAGIVEAMVADGVNVNGRGLKQRTPLMAAAAFDRPDVVRVLLKLGADVAAVDDDGNTALAVARDRGNDEVEQLLVQAGAH